MLFSVKRVVCCCVYLHTENRLKAVPDHTIHTWTGQSVEVRLNLLDFITFGSDTVYVN